MIAVTWPQYLPVLHATEHYYPMGTAAAQYWASVSESSCDCRGIRHRGQRRWRSVTSDSYCRARLDWCLRCVWCHHSTDQVFASYLFHKVCTSMNWKESQQKHIHTYITHMCDVNCNTFNALDYNETLALSLYIRKCSHRTSNTHPWWRPRPLSH